MTTRRKLSISILLMALVSASAHAQMKPGRSVIADREGGLVPKTLSAIENNQDFPIRARKTGVIKPVFALASAASKVFSHAAESSSEKPSSNPATNLAVSGPAWPQWAQNPQHTGFLNVVGQDLNQNLANIVYDPLVPDEMAAILKATGTADLLVHYQVPLVDGNDVFMESKSGMYKNEGYSTQDWHQHRVQG